MVVAVFDRTDSGVSPRAGTVYIRREKGGGAGAATAVVRPAHIRRHFRGWSHRRLCPVRIGDLLPTLPPGSERRDPDCVGNGNAADDGRHAGHVSWVGPTD